MLAIPRTLPFPLHMVRSHVKPMARACATDRSNIQTHHRSLSLIPCLSLLCRGGGLGGWPQLLTPQELQLIVVGDPTLDFGAFEQVRVSPTVGECTVG